MSASPIRSTAEDVPQYQPRRGGHPRVPRNRPPRHALSQHLALVVLRSLRARDLLDAYRSHLPAEHHAAVFASIAGVWLPFDVALAHYAACDALGLAASDIVAIGREAANHVHGTVLATFVRLAKGAGVTPWTVLVRLQDLWQRIFIGGCVSVVKLGPKDARLDIAGWPIAASSYCRTAMRGVIPAVVDLFCARSYARELPERASKTSLAFSLSWV